MCYNTKNVCEEGLDNCTVRTIYQGSSPILPRTLAKSCLLYTSIIKVTKQWTMLPEKYLDLSENENSQAYSAIFGKLPGSPRDGGKIMYYSIDEVPEIYHGAAHKRCV